MKSPSLWHASTWLRVVRPSAITLACALALTACSKDEAAAPASSQGAPVLPVGVVTVEPTQVGVVTELPGRVDASRVAEVRARVAGIVQKRVFTEGADVKAGQLLYVIDSAPYEATLQNAQATLARAEANLQQTSSQLERYRPLVEANAISKQDFVNAEAAQKQAQAEVAAAKASVRSAKINLDYARVTAPISGRIGQALVTEGALVGQGTATPLAVIQQIDPVYVNFTQSAADSLKLRKALSDGQYTSAGKEGTEVKVLLDDGTEYELNGKLLFSDISVDPTTGQVTLRAEVPNPKGLLLPGLYVRIRMETAKADNVIALPQQAVTRTQQGNTVTVLDKDGKLSTRNVQISMAQDNQWIVQEGLQPGEQVVVDGLQKLQLMPPGTAVKPVPWKPSAAESAAAPASQGPSAAAK